MSFNPPLKLDWCSRDAALYAVKRWHYSRTLPSSKNVFIGIWEDGCFVGTIIFGVGSGNATNGSKYGLRQQWDMAELARIAMAPDHTTPVSRVISIAVKMLRRQSPGLRMLISMADQRQNHHGGIYQAAGWIYTGETAADREYLMDGRWVHHRTATSSRSLTGLKSRLLPKKHRYLLPLDAEMRAKVEPLRQPYPKRAGSEPSDTPRDQRGKGGAAPTPALHLAT